MKRKAPPEVPLSETERRAGAKEDLQPLRLILEATAAEELSQVVVFGTCWSFCSSLQDFRCVL